ncbi:MAG: GNAT family N-acetyltransferase [Planctomycetota bacterium]|jgi:amino-acid N-acetyltransferase|nr:GNAT family N-acetyltransferase [Planctomycetota bacterium]MDA0919767.1 GNAT family N-acetyltransferase [Planctomycetota bacterium]MDA1160823.1 GNAT family N-acetyltransferase [Planctomycetota bacterium]
MSEIPLPPSVEIRPVAREDLAGLARFIQPFVDEGKLLPRTTEELEELVYNGFVAETDGRLIGFAALEIYSRKLAEVRSLAVAAEFQGKGVGRALVQQCVERARKRDILEVMAITSSEVFFRSCGFDFTLPGEKKALFITTSEPTQG